MVNLLLFVLLFIPSIAVADLLSPNNGVRAPQSMMVSGNSVIDSKDTIEKTSNQNQLLDGSEDYPAASLLLDDIDTLGTDGAYTTPATAPIDPFVPAPEPVTKPNIKQVLKQVPIIRVQRSITDDRIDDGYVQGLIRNNSTFTPTID